MKSHMLLLMKFKNYPKSSQQVKVEDLRALITISRALGECEAVCFSNDPRIRKIETVMVYPWREGIEKFFYTQP